MTTLATTLTTTVFPWHEDNDGGGECPPQSSMIVQAGEGLYYRGDDDLMDEVFDDDYNDKYFLSIPGEEGIARGCNRVLGGPQPNPNATSAELVRYRAERKKFTDKKTSSNICFFVSNSGKVFATEVYGGCSSYVYR